jgi:serine phosphatase RsbU (regulator of sigma subunit)
VSDHSEKRIRDELVQGLHDLACLAREDVPGCTGASISLVAEDSVATVAATEQRITSLDEAQYRSGDGPCVAGMRDQHEVTVRDYRHEQRWPEVTAEALRAGIHSSHSLPLLEDGKTLGGLNLYGAAPGAFTEASRRSAETFARQAALTLGHLRQLHTERSARARENHVAATLQRSLLPTLPRLQGITCAARYLVSHQQAQVGGDWYDVFALPDGAIGVAIGDVMGHDVTAAAAMGQLRSVLRSYAYEGSSPSVVLDRLDRLVQGFDMAQVATAIFGRLLLDEGGATLLFANAGHLPPLLRRPDGRVHRIDRAASPLIGVLEPGGPARKEAAVPLPSGSLLVLYTDGLVETSQRDYDAGIHKLCAAVAATAPHEGPEGVCDAIIAAMRCQPQDDDIALLAIGIG